VDARELALALQRGGRAQLSLSARHIAELLSELRPLLEGATVAEIVGLPPRDLLLFFRDTPGDAAHKTILRLRISADGDAPRLHLQTTRQQRPDGPVGPFFRRVIADVTGATLRRLEQVSRDRIVRLDFINTPGGEARSVLAELTGRHANLVLLGPGERVLDVLVAPPPAKQPSAARAPRLVSGATWQAPPGGSKALEEGPSLLEALDEVAVDTEARPDARAPLSFFVQENLGRAVAELGLQRDRRQVAERIERKLKRARSLAHGLQQRLEASDDAERVRLDGEALKSNLHLVQRGMERIELPDPFGEEGAVRVVAIDARRSPRENLELLFERYKKLLRAHATVESELALATQRVRELEEFAANVESAPDPLALDAQGVERGLLDAPQEADVRKRAAPEPRKPYRRFVGSRGSEIRVGKTARDNDDLTQHHCRGNDVWLHTADAPGSHVVLVLEKNAEPDSEEVLDAAHLAVHFSPLRGATRANVHVARGKQVHKPRGAKPGLVMLSGGKSLAVRMQPERLKRLLDAVRS
jgi:predicted ribosome quality control (RQC) complex YloA/Tae2 family protein